MANQKLATVTNELIESYGNTAKNVINAYRVGNERAVVFMDHSFATALSKAGTRLSTQTRRNAVATEKKITAYYAKGIEMTSANADIVIDKAVELAEKGVVQVAANAGRFEKSTGVTALTTLAIAAVPAAKAVTKVAAKIEAQSGVLASKIAGKSVKARVATAKRAVAKKVVVAKKAVVAKKPVVAKKAAPAPKAA
jgi:hypothetical protein